MWNNHHGCFIEQKHYLTNGIVNPYKWTYQAFKDRLRTMFGYLQLMQPESIKGHPFEDADWETMESACPERIFRREFHDAIPTRSRSILYKSAIDYREADEKSWDELIFELDEDKKRQKEDLEETKDRRDQVQEERKEQRTDTSTSAPIKYKYIRSIYEREKKTTS